MNSPESPITDGSIVDCCARARGINARWIVHGGLNRAASDYMAHLEATDPARFQHSCRNACLLVDVRDRLEDPKPWFYAGLFSLATADEKTRFIAQHHFTCAAISAQAEGFALDDSPELTEKLRRIRDALRRLPH